MVTHRSHSVDAGSSWWTGWYFTIYVCWRLHTVPKSHFLFHNLNFELTADFIPNVNNQLTYHKKLNTKLNYWTLKWDFVPVCLADFSILFCSCGWPTLPAVLSIKMPSKSRWSKLISSKDSSTSTLIISDSSMTLQVVKSTHKGPKSRFPMPKR